MPRRESVAGCAAILLLTGLFLYSPLHQHTRYQACGFTDIEHGGALQPSAQPLVSRPVLLLWRPPGEAPALLPAAAPTCAFGRAPPLRDPFELN